ncbi:hypothetical protein M9979_13790 [Sphingomonas sp. RP10(2022)]|uniref:Uncharacterized protein n=1 Tax=Sphingomonas liriopis TaxID=2949094 RepID=A0A9X2KRD6_9SPHN|nr:hypothetical protein [Sphingomonas liriopis]MCP3735942.1 hypothetical protein [Sphingomonas liriopis]
MPRRVAPRPASAQAWSTIRATPASPVDYQVAKTRDDIRDGRRAGQLSKAEARELHRENARVGALAGRYAEGGTTEPERAFTQGAAEAVHGIVVAKRSRSKP